MARKIKNPVVVTMSKVVGEKLYRLLSTKISAGNGVGRLASIVGQEIDTQVGRTFTMELLRKDALVMHRLALDEVQMGNTSIISGSTYSRIEKAFRDAYDARVRRSVGE